MFAPPTDNTEAPDVTEDEASLKVSDSSVDTWDTTNACDAVEMVLLLELLNEKPLPTTEVNAKAMPEVIVVVVELHTAVKPFTDPLLYNAE